VSEHLFDQYIGLLVVLSPLILTVIVRVFSPQFIDFWDAMVDREDDEEILAQSGDYKQITVFAFDKFQVQLLVAISFGYATLVSVSPVIIGDSGETIFIGFTILFFLLTIASILYSQRWFNQSEVTPSTYYEYYYGGDQDEVIHEYLDNLYFRPEASPKNIALIIQLLLVIYVAWVKLTQLPA